MFKKQKARRELPDYPIFQKVVEINHELRNASKFLRKWSTNSSGRSFPGEKVNVLIKSILQTLGGLIFIAPIAHEAEWYRNNNNTKVFIYQYEYESNLVHTERVGNWKRKFARPFERCQY